ncbi:hypothetical protein E4T89_04175 [Jeotgalicoccus nanhaiensis]|uniref:Apea-like HEPN domain-containing protein n=1 Tax=Jeotgalicoccus nanhaiensis TaxID=568603 RepID=A0ABR9XWS5_9STAP|nr:hypothetical protein [Jeotgalicoccus nanhaiensis]MBF0753460.1 hypothetical protein [Jeotgalicoccus nanhaiensis]TFU62619.1 hypothetical protein E4T89_04175 [Jeotgalicoccus nanhaiensis]
MEELSLIKTALKFIMHLTELNDADCFEIQQTRGNKTIVKYDEEKIIGLLSENKSFDNLEMYSNNTYEYPIEVGSFRRYEEDSRKINLEGKYSGREIKLEISEMSSLYFLKSILNYIDGMDERSIRKTIMKSMRFSRFRRNTRAYIIQEDESLFQKDNELQNECIDLVEYIIKYVQFETLKISNESIFRIEKYRKLRISFIFEHVYRNGVKFENYFSLEELFRYKDFLRKVEQENVNEKIPAREYDPNLIDFYSRASNTDDYYIKYISYYHIMEFYYDKVYKEKLIEEVQELITQPDFSYNNTNDINGIIKKVKSRVKINRDDGQGNEFDSLKIILEKFASADEIKKRLNEQDIELLSYYAENTVKFSGGKELQWKDKKGIYSSIARRIYDTRNSLIHSKDNEDYKWYNPFKDEEELIKEIPLVKTIAEQIIINSAEIIK